MKLNRILLVEDEPDIQKIIRLSLSLLSNVQLLTTDRGQEALQLAWQTRPDVILLDIMMPEVNGYQTFAQLQQNPQTRDIPVIFLSAKTQQAEIAYGLSLGVTGYITKPFDPMKFPEHVLQILQQGQGLVTDGRYYSAKEAPC